jgi:hypothetical protein
MWNSEEGWGNRFSTRLEPGSITDRQQFIKTLSLAAEQSTALDLNHFCVHSARESDHVQR